MEKSLMEKGDESDARFLDERILLRQFLEVVSKLSRGGSRKFDSNQKVC